MVAIVTGNGLGLQSSSALGLGSQGQLGQAGLGKSGEQAYVNAANGNLILRGRDQLLIGQGVNSEVYRAYNSQAQLEGQNWRPGTTKTVNGLSGELGAEGSSVVRTDWDGSSVSYAWEASRGRYVASSGVGACDTLVWDSGAQQWLWTQGGSEMTERYEATLGGRLSAVVDRDGNAVQYLYNTAGLLSEVRTASGEATYLDYAGTHLIQLRTLGQRGETTTVRYEYDGLGRLSCVKVDLSPEDGNIADGRVYSTSYGYDGSSGRIASIIESDGTMVAFTYLMIGGEYRVTTLSQTSAVGEVRTTTLDYDVVNRRTTITDPLGQATVLSYDGQGRLLQSTMPAVNGTAQTQRFTYGSNGQVSSVEDALGRVTRFTYDSAGNRVRQEDALGNVVVRTFGADNQLLSETLSGPGSATTQTRYVYDTKGHLRFVVSADGRVSEQRYNLAGQVVATLAYTAGRYPSGGAFNEAALRAWADARQSEVSLTETRYDFRGNVDTVTTYGAVRVDGSGVLDDQVSQVRYVYDPAGRLVQRYVGPIGQQRAEQYSYDALGRVLSATTLDGRVTLYQYDDARQQTIVTFASGLVRTSTYSLAGELLAMAESQAGQVLSQVRYQYDRNGRLRLAEDAAGARTHYLYDEAGRQVALIDAGGKLTEFHYDGNNQITHTRQYASRVGAAVLASLTDANGFIDEGASLVGVRPAEVPDDRNGWRLYDEGGRLVRTVDSTGAMVGYRYDASFRLIETVAYGNSIDTAAFAADPSLLRAEAVVRSTQDRVTRYFYLADGPLQGVLDASGALTEYLYDGAGRRIETIRYASSVAAASETLDGLRPAASVQDVHQYAVYDRRGLLLSEVDGEGYVTRYRYDSQGNVTERIRGERVAAASLNTPTQVSGAVRARGAAGPGGVWPQLEVWVDGIKVSTLTLTAIDTTYAFTAMVAPGAAHQVSVVYANAAPGREATITQASLAGAQFDATGAVLWAAGGTGSEQGIVSVQPAGEQRLVQAGALRWGVEAAQVLAHLSTLPGPLERTEYAYDRMGRLTRQVQYASEGAAATQYTYDSEGRLVGEQRGDRTSTWRYDVQGRLIGELGGMGSAALAGLGVDPSQAQIDAVWSQWGTHYEYDAAGRRTSATDALGHTSHYYYDVTGRMTHAVNALGEVIGYQYNAFGEVSQTTTYANRLSSLILGGLRGGALSEALAETFRQLDGSQSSTVTLNYNVLGLVNRRLDALGNVTDYGYTRFGELATETQWSDPGTARTTSYRYDAVGRTVEVGSPFGNGTAYSQLRYDAFGRVIETVDAQGVSRSQAFDRRGQVVTVQDGLGAQSRLSYDAFGNVLSQTDRTGKTTTYQYSAFNREVRMKTPGGIQTVTRFGEHGQMIAVVDGRGNATTYDYDSDGLLVRTTSPAGTVASGYDRAGQLIESVDARGVRTVYQYDAAGRVLTRTLDPEGLALIERFEYDGKGQSIRSIDAGGMVTETRYDNGGQTVQVTRDVGTGKLNLTTTFEYDGIGQLLRVTEAAGTAAARVTAYGYDPSGFRVSSIGDPDGLALATRYSYDANGNVVARTDANGFVTRYVYDGENQLRFTLAADGSAQQLIRDAEGRVTRQVSYGARVSTSALERLNGALDVAAVLGLLTPDARQDRTTSYTYDANGRLATTAVSGVTTTLTYDAAGNVLRSSRSSGPFDQSEQTIYDTANRPQFQINAGGYVTGYRYDANGNALERVAYAARYTGAATAAALQSWAAGQEVAARIVDTWAYDSAGRLVWHINAAGTLTEQRYDAAGRVVAQLIYSDPGAPRSGTKYQLESWAETRQSRAAVTRYVYDSTGARRFIQDAEGYISELRYDAAGQLTATLRYNDRFASLTVHDTASSLAERLGGSEVATSVLRYDAAGRVVEQIDALGGITRFEVDGLGQVTAVHVAWATAQQVTTLRKYDRQGNLVEEIRAAGSAVAATTRYAYNAFGQQVAVIDPRGIDLVESDSEWALAQRKALGYVNETGTPWRAADLSAAQKSALMSRYTSTSEYDNTGNRIRSTDALGNATVYAYDSFGNLVQVTDARGNTGYFLYDLLGRVIVQVDPSGYQTRTEYDVMGNAVVISRHLTQMASYNSRVNENLSPWIIRSDGELLTSMWQWGGFLDAPPEGPVAVTRLSYDNLGRLCKAIDAMGGVELYSYDAHGNRTSYTNKLGGVTRFTYDRLGQLLSEQLPAQVRAVNGSNIALVNRYTYDAGGNRISSVEAEGTAEQRAVSYSFDALNRQTVRRVTVATSAGATVQAQETTRYDLRGNVIEQTDANGNARVYYYDASNRVTAQVGPSGALTLTLYDQVGNVASTRSYENAVSATADGPMPAAPSGVYREVQYRYDANNRLVESRVPDVVSGRKAERVNADGTVDLTFEAVTGHVIQTWEYDANGQIIRHVDGNGGVTRNYYDALGRKVYVVDAGGYSSSWDYDAEGNVVKEILYNDIIENVDDRWIFGARKRAYTGVSPLGPGLDLGVGLGLDAGLGLDFPVEVPIAPDKDRVTDYTYDLMGRRLSETRSGVAYGTLDVAGRLTKTAGNVSTNYAYDAAGNLVRSTDANGNERGWEYDLLGRNIAIVLPGMVDFAGRNVRARTEYSYNGLNQVVQEVRRGAVDGEVQVDSYAYGVAGRLLSKTNAFGHTTYFSYDAAGNMAAMNYTRTDSAGGTRTETVSVSYDAEGREVYRSTVGSDGARSAERRVKYNLFGDVTGRGTGSEGWQEFAEYDNAGRAVKSNTEGGITYAYLYDANGNSTMRMESQASDLRSLSLQQILELPDVFATYTVYDQRNQAIEVIQPSMETTGERLKVSSGWAASQGGSDRLEIVLGGTGPASPRAPQLTAADGALTVTPGTGQLGMLSFSMNQVKLGTSIAYSVNIPDLTKVFGQYDVVLTGTGMNRYGEGYDSGYGYGNPPYVSLVITNCFERDIGWMFGVSIGVSIVQKSTGKTYYIGGFATSGTIYTANNGSWIYPFMGGTTNVSVPSSLKGIQLPADGFRSDINPQVYVRPFGSTGAFQSLPLDRSVSPATANISGLANGEYEVLYLAERNGAEPTDVALMRREQYRLVVGSDQSISRVGDSYSAGSAYLTHPAGTFVMLAGQLHLVDLRTRLGQTPSGAYVEYRRKGSQDAWQSSGYLGNVPPMATWGSHVWNTSGLNGDYEVLIRLVGGNGVLDTLAGDVRIGTDPRVDVKYQAIAGAGTLRLSGLPAAADRMSLVVRRPNGTVAAVMDSRNIVNGALEWIMPATLQAEMMAGTANWTFEATFTDDGVLPPATYTVARTLAISTTGVTSGDLNFSAIGGVSGLTFDPKLPAGNAIKLYFRPKGSAEEDFQSITLLKDRDGIYRWDAIGLRQGGEYEYYYDVYVSREEPASGSALTRVTGYFTPTAAASQTGWVLWKSESIGPTSVMIRRKQAYDAFGQVISETDGRGNTTRLEYNNLGLLTGKIDPRVQVTRANGYREWISPETRYTYDRVGSLIAYKDANGNLTTQAWNYGSATPVVATEWHADGGVKSYGYDVYGNQRVVVDEIGRRTDYTYDAGNRLVQIDRPLLANGDRNHEYYEYDELDRRIAHRNTLGRETTDYDIEGNVSRAVSMAGRVIEWAATWVPAGNEGYWQRVMTDANGRSTVDDVDAHGRLLVHQDMSGRRFDYVYNYAGLLARSGATSYEYYNNGLLKYLRSSEQGTVGYYEYDKNGNRTFEGFTGMDGRWGFQQSVATYDSLNRLVKISDPRYAIDYEYDAMGNRIHMRSEYNDGLGGNKQVQDYWYQYDSMNRFVVTMGQLKDGVRGTSASDARAQVWVGSTGGDGVRVSYDMANQRRQAVYASDGHKEDYSYDAQGYLTDTYINNVLRARRANDLAGRVTTYVEYAADGRQIGNLTRTWDQDSLLTREHDNITNTGTITYRMADGTVDHTKTYGDKTTQTMWYTYGWYDGARQTEIKVQADNSDVKNWAPGFSKYEYDSQGRIKIAYDVAGNRGFRYQTDGEGRILQRDELIGGQVDGAGKVTGATNNRFHSYYLFDDRQVGNVGNDGIDRIDYAKELAQHQADSGAKNDARHKRFTPVAGADFDSNYQPINSMYPGSAPSSYLVRTGDTLQSIALALWGDSAMWYVLADANGLTAQDPLTPNTSLTVPNKVTNIHNNAGTFKPYDTGAAMGNTNPTVPDAPPPPQQSKGGCGKFVQILAIVVAVIVTIYTAGVASGAAWGFASAMTAGATTAGAGAMAIGAAVGSIASQGVMIAGGQQSGLDWKAVALSAAGGAIAGGLNSAGFTTAMSNAGIGAAGQVVVRSAVGNVANQGVSMLAGRQNSFDWKSVAISAVSATVSNKVGAMADQRGWHPVVQYISSGASSGAISALMRGSNSDQVLLQAGLDGVSATIGGMASRQQEAPRASLADELSWVDMSAANAELGERLESRSAALLEMRADPSREYAVGEINVPLRSTRTDSYVPDPSVTQTLPRIQVRPEEAVNRDFMGLYQWSLQYGQPAPQGSGGSYLSAYRGIMDAYTRPVHNAYLQEREDIFSSQRSVQRFRAEFAASRHVATEAEINAMRGDMAFLKANAMVAGAGILAGAAALSPLLQLTLAADGVYEGGVDIARGNYVRGGLVMGLSLLGGGLAARDVSLGRTLGETVYMPAGTGAGGVRNSPRFAEESYDVPNRVGAGRANGTVLMNRGDAVGELYDAQKLERVLEAAQRQGVGVMRGEEAERLLNSIGAKAAYWPQEGAPGTLFLPTNPTRSMVLEELLHYGQYKRAGFPTSNPLTGGHIQGLEFEIQAQQRLGSLAQAKGWSPAEVQHFKTAEVEWKKLLHEAFQKDR